MDLRSQLCSAGFSCTAITLLLDICTKTFQPNSFMLTGTTILCFFQWVLKGQQHKAEPLCFIFSYTFRLVRKKFEVMFKQFKLNILILILSESALIKGNSCCFTDCVNNVNISMH